MKEVNKELSKLNVNSSLSQLHKHFGKLFYNLGYRIAEFPSYFIVIPVLLSLLGLTGIQQIDYINDPDYLFNPTNGKYNETRRIINKLFPFNRSSNFDVSRVTGAGHFAHLIVSTKDNGTMLKEDVFNEVVYLNDLIQNMSLLLDGISYNYSDICAQTAGKCWENIVLRLQEFMPEIENGSMVINYPVMMYPFSIPSSFGGPVVNESEGALMEAKAVQLLYWFKDDDREPLKRSQSFERKLLDLLDQSEFEHIKVYRFTSISLGEELEKNVLSRAPYILLSFILMMVCTVVSIFMTDWVRSKLSIGIFGIFSTTFATGCSFGVLMYCGIPFCGINISALFLLLGIGLGGMFVLLAAWQRTSIQETVPVRLAKTYSHCAVSITISSLTNALSLFTGYFTPINVVKLFCVYTGFAILFTYIWFVTVFGACLAIAGYREQEGKHNVTCRRPVIAKSKSAGLGFCYKLWCTGGIDPEDPLNPNDNKPHFAVTFFKDYLGKALNITSFKVLVTVMYFVYMSGAIYGCSQVNEGLKLDKLTRDDSYLKDYFEADEELFKKYTYRIQVIIDEKLTYSNPDTKNAILELHNSFENLNCIAPSMFTQSWMKGFYRFLDRNSHFKENITDEISFIEIMKSEYFAHKKPITYQDIKFNDDETEIMASRFIIQSYDVKSTIENVNMMWELENIVTTSPIKIRVFQPLFPVFEQFTIMKFICIQTIVITAFVMMIVSIIFIPNPLCLLWVVLTVISIEVGVVGYMSLWDVNLDSISVMNLIMCVGFSVDFSAHISYAYLTSQAPTPSGKVEDCLCNMGLPILQGAVSTVVGVISLTISPSYIFTAFFKITILVSSFGLLHSLFFLPIMLSSFSLKSRLITPIQ